MSNAEEERKRRLAQSLRENLRRRKGQARDSARPSDAAGEEGDPGLRRDRDGAA